MIYISIMYLRGVCVCVCESLFSPSSDASTDGVCESRFVCLRPLSPGLGLSGGAELPPGCRVLPPRPLCLLPAEPGRPPLLLLNRGPAVAPNRCLQGHTAGGEPSSFNPHATCGWSEALVCFQSYLYGKGYHTNGANFSSVAPSSEEL